MTRLESTISALGDLVSFQTVSSESNLELIAYIASRLEDCSAKVHLMTDKSGKKANLFATIGPEDSGGIVLSGHTDVVPAEEKGWLSDPYCLREENGRFFGRGTCDMKGFIAAILAITPDISARKLKRPIHLSFTYDEEVGCFGVRHLADEFHKIGLSPAVAIVDEPTNMRIIEGHMGDCEYTTYFHGLAGHASNPESWVSAVEYPSKPICEQLDVRDGLRKNYPESSRFDPPWMTLQVGQVIGGGAHNVIADHCQVDWEIRPVTNEDMSHLKRRVYVDSSQLNACLSKLTQLTARATEEGER